jgi:hypothetical protein
VEAPSCFISRSLPTSDANRRLRIHPLIDNREKTFRLSDERKRLVNQADTIITSALGDDPPRSDVIEAALTHLIQSKKNVDNARGVVIRLRPLVAVEVAGSYDWVSVAGLPRFDEPFRSTQSRIWATYKLQSVKLS